MDYDLLSLQEARILVENATYAHKWLKTYSQEQLDTIVSQTAKCVKPFVETFCKAAYEETQKGTLEDKITLTHFVMHQTLEAFSSLKCVGILEENPVLKTKEIGVPYGVMVAIIPETNAVSATLYYALSAIKSGNTLIVAPSPSVKNTVAQVMTCLIEVAEKCGLPQGNLSYFRTVTPEGICSLMRHPGTKFVLNGGEKAFLKEGYYSEKPFIYSSNGNGPAFIERTADLRAAVEAIVSSKSFDNGLLVGTESAVVVDAPVHETVLQYFKDRRCYVLSPEEQKRLISVLDSPIEGKKACEIARMANITVPCDTTLLIALQDYVPEKDPFVKELRCPILPYYIEKNWQNACEKCIELLLTEQTGHTLTIHAQDEAVIEQFALKKPVGRVLVNTPAGFGSIGATTNLFPSISLGSGSTGKGLIAENVSPCHMVYKRKVGYGVRAFNEPIDLKQWIEKIVNEVLSK